MNMLRSMTNSHYCKLTLKILAYLTHNAKWTFLESNLKEGKWLQYTPQSIAHNRPQFGSYLYSLCSASSLCSVSMIVLVHTVHAFVYILATKYWHRQNTWLVPVNITDRTQLPVVSADHRWLYWWLLEFPQ